MAKQGIKTLANIKKHVLQHTCEESEKTGQTRL